MTREDLLIDILARARAELERAEARARQRKLLPRWEWIEAEIRRLVMSRRIGGAVVVGGAVPYSYTQPATSSRLTVLWAGCRWRVEAARDRAPKRPRGAGAWLEELGVEDVIARLDPERAFRRLERRRGRERRRLEDAGFQVPDGWVVERVHRWATMPGLAYIEGREFRRVAEYRSAIVTPWAAIRVIVPGRVTLTSVLARLAEETGIEVERWRVWLADPAAADPTEVENELAIGRLARTF